MKGWTTPPPNRDEPRVNKSFYNRKGKAWLTIEYWNSEHFFISWSPGRFEFIINHWPENK